MILAALALAAALVPQPKEIRFGDGAFALDGRMAADVVKWSEDASVPSEGYRLTVTPQGISAAASDAAGRFYALETLKQLADGGRVPCVTVSDAPAYPWRALFLDESRHFFGKATVKRLLDLAAMHKYNGFHWHLTDDQGWRLALKRFPALEKYATTRPGTPPRGYEHRRESDGRPYGPFLYTEDDVREIVAYAKARHITVMPEIELPGHSCAILAAYPQYACAGTNIVPRAVWDRWGVSSDVWCVGNEEGIRFLESVLDEVRRLFGSPVIHIGGDECPTRRWKTCPKCQARMRQQGLKDERELQTWLTTRVTRYLSERGCRTVGWDEICDGEIPTNAVVMSWRGTQGGMKAAAKGHDVVMTPYNPCYFIWDQGLADDPYRADYPQWSSKKVTLKTVYGFNPRAGLPPEAARHVIGAEGCLWTEYIYDEDELMWNAWPRACALAEVLWTGERRRDYPSFRAALARHLPRLAAAGVRSAPLPTLPPANGGWEVKRDGRSVEVDAVTGASHGGTWWFARTRCPVTAVDADGAVHEVAGEGPQIVDDERRANALIVGDLERRGPIVLVGRTNEVIRGALILAPKGTGVVFRDCENVRLEDSLIRADGDAVRIEGGSAAVRNCTLWSDGGAALKVTAGRAAAEDVRVHFAAEAILSLQAEPGRSITQSSFRNFTCLNDNDDVPIAVVEGAVSDCRFADLAVVGRRGRFKGTVRVAGRDAGAQAKNLVFENIHTFEDPSLTRMSPGVSVGPYADGVVFKGKREGEGK